MTSVSSVASPIQFQATWNAQNEHLADTFLDKVTRFVLFLLNAPIRYSILPAARKSQATINETKENFQALWGPQPLSNRRRFMQRTFTPKPIEVVTPDGVKIRGTHFKTAAARVDSPTVIFFQPNAMLSKQGVFDRFLLQAALMDVPYNFIYFDHRDCAESDHVAPHSKNALYLDGDSIYQFVRDHLKVPAKDIHFYGFSLGAGISANVKKNHPECDGRYVNERSFTSINDVIHNIVPSVLAYIANFFIWSLNWNIESESAIPNLKGKTLIVHHPEDELMRKGASPYQALFQRGVTPPNIEQLDLSRASRKPGFIHGAQLSEFSHENFDPESEIGKFLFFINESFTQRMLNLFARSTPEFQRGVYARVALLFQNGGSYFGSGEDAFYNRNGLNLSDAQRAEAIAEAKIVAG